MPCIGSGESLTFDLCIDTLKTEMFALLALLRNQKLLPMNQQYQYLLFFFSVSNVLL